MGQPKTRRHFRNVCTDDGTWIGETCERVTCDPLDTVFTGMYLCTDNFSAQSVCTLQCPNTDDPEHETEVTCQVNGEWSGNFKMCTSVTGECPSLPRYTEVEFIDCDEQSVGSSCKVQCPGEFLYSPMISNETSSFKDLERSQLTAVTKVTCTGQKVWHPNPTQIICVEKCMTFSIGDEFCDSKNNRAYCTFDGGDCCASTTPDGVVRPFPQTCDTTKECGCHDPTAVENLPHMHGRNNSRSNRRAKMRAKMMKALFRRKLSRN